MFPADSELLTQINADIRTSGGILLPQEG